MSDCEFQTDIGADREHNMLLSGLSVLRSTDDRILLALCVL